MSRVYWDTMLFIYLLEDNQQYFSRVEAIYERMRMRGDTLYTSYLTLGEVLAGTRGSVARAQVIREALAAMEVQFLPFDAGAVDTFAVLRTQLRLGTADSIHLACAAAKGMDLFLTGDRQLSKKFVPGIQFISGIEGSPI